MNCDHPKETGVEVSAAPVTPEVPGNDRGDDNSPYQCNREIIPVLPLHDGVLTQIADVGRSGLNSWFHEHPHHMGLNAK